MLKLKELSETQKHFLKSNTLDESLGDWKFFLPIKEDSKVLCLGFYSIGSVLSLSKSCGQLFILSEFHEKPKVYKVIEMNKSPKNLHFIYGSLGQFLPFLNERVDIIDIDWKGLFSICNLKNKIKIDCLEKFFSEIYRILKPQGSIYFSSCSHFIATAFKKERIGFYKPLNFWLNKLEKVGFRKFRRYLLYPDPYYFGVAFSLDSNKNFKSYLEFIPDAFWGKRKLIKRYFLSKILNNKNLSYFLPGFGIVATKE